MHQIETIMIRFSLQSSYTLLICSLFLVLLDSSQADDIGVYWGSIDEETLGEVCATGKYSYVNIAYLDTLGNGQTPEIYLGDHCNASTNGCTHLSKSIRACQMKGIKVMLSVEGPYNLTSTEDAKNVSDYLWNNFLGGKSSSQRPFGDAVLDGIEFTTNSYPVYLEDLTHYLKSYTTQNILYLSASPPCSLGIKRKTLFDNGFFDYLSVRFYNNPRCEYKYSNAKDLINSWNKWSSIKVGKVFLVLPADSGGGLTGYIPTTFMKSQILPVISKSYNYGGIMLESRYGDRKNAYSDSITSPLCRQQSAPHCGDVDFTETSGYMSMPSFRIDESEVISHHCCKLICQNNYSCNAYAPANYATNTGCQIWSKESTFIRTSPSSNGEKIYVANRDHTPEGSRKHHAVNMFYIRIIAGVGTIIAFPCCCYISYVFWSKYKAKVDTKQKQKKLIHDIGGNAMLSIMNSSMDKKIKKEATTNDEFEIFSFESMATATNNFSAANKLGEGGFGPVYKGRLSDNQEIAIKRLSRSSGQGLIEFKNEAKLIAKLQHTNLVRLLGLCIEREERMLVYEYMPNRSLDFHLFDAERKNFLNWERRLSIIEGVAQGILYLHKYSRLKVIHRDLKASNILLDDKLNPKISDFGIARILGLKESEEQTDRIVGTYGYMSPEYILNGVISTKTDVFSFGVLLLEIICAKKNYRSYNSDFPLNLTGHAWQLWNEGRALELMDPRLNETCTPNEVLRCMHIGLLCVQDHATDRPTMFEVVSFLSNHSLKLSRPKHPAFFINVDRYKSGFPGDKQEKYSINYVTLSDVDGR